MVPQIGINSYDEWHGRIDLAPTGTNELERAEGVATAGAQSANENTGVNDDLRRLHGGIVDNTNMASNYVLGGRTAGVQR